MEGTVWTVCKSRDSDEKKKKTFINEILKIQLALLVWRQFHIANIFRSTQIKAVYNKKHFFINKI